MMKTGKTHSYFFIVLFLLLETSFLQPCPVLASGSEQPDIIYMIFDKSFYVTGETIWYKIHLLQKNPDTGVLHIGIFDSQGNLLGEQKLKVTGYSVCGSFPVPIEWPDDNYRFIVSTRWNLNFDDKGIFEHIVPVYNSSLPTNYSSAEFAMAISQHTADNNTRPAPGIDIKFDKEFYSPDDTVRIKLESSSRKSFDLAISVTDLTQVPYATNDITTSNQTLIRDYRNYQQTGAEDFKPEKKLELEGILQTPDRSAIINSKVLSIRLVTQNQFIRTGTVNGRFIAECPDFYHEDIIQVLDMNPYQNQMPYVKPVSLWDHITLADFPGGAPPHTPEVDSYIYHARLRRKINEIYHNRHPYIHYSETAVNNLPEPDIHYDMSKFKNLDDLRDFVINVMLSVDRFAENGHTSLRLYNDRTHYNFMHHPWYLVDGLLTFDESSILSTPFSSLVSLDFYTNAGTLKHFEPLMIMNGIVRVTTNDRHWEKEILAGPNTFIYDGFYSGEPFLKQQPELDSRNRESPDFRPVVYWDPEVTPGGRIPAEISFKTSDNPGLFLVEISGTDEKGKIIHGTYLYRVRNQ